MLRSSNLLFSTFFVRYQSSMNPRQEQVKKYLQSVSIQDLINQRGAKVKEEEEEEIERRRKERIFFFSLLRFFFHFFFFD